MKKLILVLVLFFCLGNVNAKNINQNVDISDEGYEKLSKFMSDYEINMINQNTYDMFMNNDIIAYKSSIIETTYYSNYISFPQKVNEKVMSVDEYVENNNSSNINLFTASSSDVVETNMKYIRLTILGNGTEGLTFSLVNEWLSMPKYKSFDVIALRWTGDFALSSYRGYQLTSENSDDIYYYEGNGNYKFGTKAFGLSQNLVNSATSIDNELYANGTCSSGGIVYGTYQHAQANITLATSKLYNFSSNGMGGVLSFYGNASGIYDNTPGLSLSYTC